MVKNGEFFVIKEMHAKGMYLTHISKKLGRDPKTIRKWLEQDEPSRYQRTSNQISKLDAHKDYIVRSHILCRYKDRVSPLVMAE